MTYRSSFILYHKYRNVLLQESRRYAGHSKWQNIKHIKGENDAEKSRIFRALTIKMKVAVLETGNTDPSTNPKLSNIVDQAKKANMPGATLKAALDRLKNQKQNAKPEMFIVRCPGGAMLVLQVVTTNITITKGNISAKLKKHNCTFADAAALGGFDYICNITTSKDCNADQAMEDAIKINAQDMEEVIEDDKPLFMFKCEFGNSARYVSQLRNMGYSIISIEDTCLPKSEVELSESDLKNVNALKEKLFTLDEVDKIEDNILEP
ncbi:translational activator of cytochrome c oxidase 1 [Nomia melanderi]|uniref:translational activator of cytochrome c oxidase 1 n=1 Tax=Nomia melanderi TaxID=2448451 RepID=UPI0013043FAA|nr:translational activator of cytochrome c oxidase 1 [Nomia melanderi]